MKATNLNEMEILYKKSTLKGVEKITSSNDAAKIFRSIIRQGQVEVREHMIVLYLNRSNEVLGYHIHSIGGVSGTTVDIKIVLGLAVKSLASGIILAHNHPSGQTLESHADKTVTEKLKKAAKLHDISLLDHLIITLKEHKSFVDNGLLGMENYYPIIPLNIEIIEESNDPKHEIQIHIDNLKKYLSK